MSFATCLINLWYSAMAQDALGWLFCISQESDHSPKSSGTFRCKMVFGNQSLGGGFAHCCWYVICFFFWWLANDDGRRREHYYICIDLKLMLSLISSNCGCEACVGINLFLVDVSFVGKICRVIWIQETILIWALTRTLRSEGLLCFCSSGAL